MLSNSTLKNPLLSFKFSIGKLKVRFIAIFVIMLFCKTVSAHTWEIRVKQNANGTLTWYGQSYHGVGECGIPNSGININGVNYNWTAEFSGSVVPFSAYIFTASPSYTSCCNVSGRQSYATVTTAFIPGNLIVTAYSNNACYALYPDMPAGGGVFNPPPPACTTCPLINWNNTVGTTNNNGTPCNISDDYIPVTITVNHQNCAKSTGSGQFTVVNTSTNTTIGSYVFNETSPTIITYNAPVGTSNSTQLNVSTAFPCNVQQALTGIPNGTFSGIRETTPPSINCPANISINAASASGAVVTYTVPVGTDNCPGAITTRIAGLASGATFPIGTTTVTYRVTDGVGLTAQCSFTVTVNCVAPAITNCPATGYQQIYADQNNCSAIFSYNLNITGTPAPSVTYTFTGATTGNGSGTGSGLAFNVGQTTVTITAANACGTATCTFVVTVIDNVAPIALTKNITVYLDANGQATVTPQDVDNGSSDNCGTVTLSLENSGIVCGTAVENQNAVLTAPAGTLITAIDFASYGTPNGSCGAYSIGFCHASGSIAVVSPYLIGNNSGSVPASNGIFGDPCGGTVKRLYIQAKYTGGATQTNTFDCSNIGANTIKLIVTDVNGNVSTANAVVTVVDNTAPVITCPADINSNNTAGQCGAYLNFSVTATDNCPVTLSYSHNPGSFFPIGTTTVTVTAMDASENSSTCTFTVTVVDNELPVITCQPDVVVNIEPNTCGATVSFVNGTGNIYTSGAFDMQLRTLDGTFYSEINNVTINPSSGSYNNTTGMAKDPVTGEVYVVLHNGTNNRALAKLDLVTGNATIVGNTGRYFASIAFSSTGNLYGVTGNGSGYGTQNSLYSINKSDATSTYLTGLNGSANHALAFNTDDGKLYHWSSNLMEKIDLGSNAITNISLSGDPYYSYPGAATYTGNGNFMLLTYYGYYINSVTANGAGVFLGYNSSYAKGVIKDGTGSGISASDNCAYTLTQTAGLPSGSVFPVGTTTNTFVATDASGNTSTCSFNVTVVDNQLPTITCPADISVYATSAAGATVTYIAPVGTDNCPGSTTTLTAGFASGSTFPIGITTVTHTVTDASGNAAQCSFTVTVTGLAPQIVCPSNITVNNDEGHCGAIVNFAATETVAIPASTITYSQDPGTFFPKGTTTVTATAVNAVGTSTCTFTVTVNDTENPTITCNAPILVSNDEGQCGAVVNYTVTSTDNCAGQTIVQTAGIASGSFFPKGTTTNTFVVTDASGNTATCSFTVTVNDTENPTITCNAPIVVSNDEGQCGAVVNYTVTSTDNCAGQTIVQTAGIASGSFFPKGTTTNTFVVTDASGNTATCSFTVTVNDTEAPGITCPSDITVNCQDDNSSASTGTATATDNCTDLESIIITQTQTSTQNANPANAGHYNYVISRTWKATDESGNYSECIQTITVHDVTAPLITCPANVTVNCQDNNTSTATGVATGTDNCSAVAITQTQTSTQNANPANAGHYNYVISRTWRATDVTGNYSECVQTITVQDVTKPVITCPANITVNNATGICGSIVNFAATVTDNCSPVTITYSKDPGTVFNVGTTTVTATATDVTGNFIACSFTVTVIDNEKPIITCPVAVTATRNTNAGICTYKVLNTEFNATATDNCGVTSLTYVLSGATSGTGTSLKDVLLTRGTTTVTWTAKDAANNTISCSFTVVVNDDQNATDFMIYAEREVNFDEYHYIGGDVGVTNADGKADFKKNTVLDPFRITAKKITVHTPSAVNNRTYSPATGGPNPTFYPYTGNTTGLSNTTVSINSTLNGNWKDVTVKKGITATITGNNFGKISIEEGAVVTFTASVINMQELKIEKGKKNDNVLTIVNFANPASVKVKDKVTIEDDTRVNVGGPKVTFYAGDNTGGEEKFEVKGENSQVTANIMVPVGKLHVHGGNDVSRPTIMTGWYIIEKLDGHGKYVYWNKYNCGTATNPSFVENITIPAVISAVETHTAPVLAVDAFRVNVYPNPSAYDFSIQVTSKSKEPVTVRILDMDGKVRSVHTQLSKNNSIKVGASLIGGTYFAEVTQGSNKQVVKLVKLN